MMLTPEMIQIFDWSESERRLHYGRLMNVKDQMNDMVWKLSRAQERDGFLDLGIVDQLGEFWIALTRPGMPDARPGQPRRDLDLIEYLIEWGAGVKSHAMVELIEMDDRYPGLHLLTLADLMPAKMVYRRAGRPNRLKRWLQNVFR
jgi:hypothetical protein